MKYVLVVCLSLFLLNCADSQSGQEPVKEGTNKAHSHADDAAAHEALYEKSAEGVISGFDCAVVDFLCPTTHRGADYTNGIFTEDKKFYFIVNIPHEFLTDRFLQRIAVTGKVYNPHTNAIEPEQIYVVENGQRELVYESGYFIVNGKKTLRYTPAG